VPAGQPEPQRQQKRDHHQKHVEAVEDAEFEHGCSVSKPNLTNLSLDSSSNSDSETEWRKRASASSSSTDNKRVHKVHYSQISACTNTNNSDSDREDKGPSQPPQTSQKQQTISDCKWIAVSPSSASFVVAHGSATTKRILHDTNPNKASAAINYHQQQQQYDSYRYVGPQLQLHHSQSHEEQHQVMTVVNDVKLKKQHQVGVATQHDHHDPIAPAHGPIAPAVHSHQREGYLHLLRGRVQSLVSSLTRMP